MNSESVKSSGSLKIIISVLVGLCITVGVVFSIGLALVLRLRDAGDSMPPPNVQAVSIESDTRARAFLSALVRGDVDSVEESIAPSSRESVHGRIDRYLELGVERVLEVGPTGCVLILNDDTTAPPEKRVDVAGNVRFVECVAPFLIEHTNGATSRGSLTYLERRGEGLVLFDDDTPYAPSLVAVGNENTLPKGRREHAAKGAEVAETILEDSFVSHSTLWHDPKDTGSSATPCRLDFTHQNERMFSTLVSDARTSHHERGRYTEDGSRSVVLTHTVEFDDAGRYLSYATKHVEEGEWKSWRAHRRSTGELYLTERLGPKRRLSITQYFYDDDARLITLRIAILNAQGRVIQVGIKRYRYDEQGKIVKAWSVDPEDWRRDVSDAEGHIPFITEKPPKGPRLKVEVALQPKPRVGIDILMIGDFEKRGLLSLPDTKTKPNIPPTHTWYAPIGEASSMRPTERLIARGIRTTYEYDERALLTHARAGGGDWSTVITYTHDDQARLTGYTLASDDMNRIGSQPSEMTFVYDCAE